MHFVHSKKAADPRTTPHCRSMNGRIFALDDLISEDQNQSQLVRDNTYWESAGYFASTPTHEIIPSLPPYHFGCRTRIVPYTHGDAYETFDTMKPTDPIYPTILKDKLANYSITPQNLDTVRTYAHQCQWKKDSLEEHYKKHKHNLGETIGSAQAYHNLALAFMESDSAYTCLQFENNSLIMYVYEDMPGSKKKSYKVLVLDLDAMLFRTYSRKRYNTMNHILDLKNTSVTNQNIIAPRNVAKKRKDNMLSRIETTVEQALAETEDSYYLDMYYDTIRMHKENDVDEIKTEAIGCYDIRSDLFHVLIQADKLTDEQHTKIKEVDDFILSNDVHPLFQPLKDWLKTNHL